MNGNIYYLNISNMEISKPFKSIFYSEERDKIKGQFIHWIEDIKISPDNTKVAFSAHLAKGKNFGKLQILSISNDINNPFQELIILDPKFTSDITHLDLSTDNDRIICNSKVFELKYMSIKAKGVISASSCIYEPNLWYTWTCLLGFPVQGIMGPNFSGNIVNYICRSNNQKVIATGDFSLIKLFKYPSVVDNSEYKAYKGHSSFNPKVRFTSNDQYLISVGGKDKSVFTLITW